MRTYLGQVNMNKIFFKVAMSYEYSENHFTTYPNPKKLKNKSGFSQPSG